MATFAPPLTGLIESSLYVKDLTRARGFYERVFGFETLVAEDRFCALSVARRHVLLLFVHGASTNATNTTGGVIPPHDGHGQLHLAFAIDANELTGWEEWLRESAVPLESRVRWPRGGTSLYLRDPDDHLVELVTPGIWDIY